MSINANRIASLKPWEHFEHRVRSANLARRSLPYTQISDENRTEVIEKMLTSKDFSFPRVIYVHIPFCNKTCSFCIYNKYVGTDNKTIADYCQSVIKQINSVSTAKWPQLDNFKAVYFGGGTPSLVPSKYLKMILGAIKENLTLSDDCEITLESTVSEINKEMLQEFKNAGFNRISLGVQTFNTELRRLLGRIVDKDEIADKLKMISESGIENICIDLMYGLPGQTMKTWQEDIEMVDKLPITGCSVYSLIEKQQSKILNKEDLKLEYDFFKLADDKLANYSGWERLTPVQYGHQSKGKAVYVASHGKNADLLAFGSGAGGRIANINYFSSNQIDEYIQSNREFSDYPLTLLMIDERYLEMRNIFLLSEGLKIEKQAYHRVKDYFNDMIEDYFNCNLIELKGESIHLTQTGRFWAGNMSEQFSRRIAGLIHSNTIQ